MTEAKKLRQHAAALTDSTTSTLAKTSNELQNRLNEAALKIEDLRRLTETAPEKLASALLPTARSFTALAEETRSTLQMIVVQSRRGHEEALESVQKVSQQAILALGDLLPVVTKVEWLIEKSKSIESKTDRQRRREAMKIAAIAGGIAVLPSVALLTWLVIMGAIR